MRNLFLLILLLGNPLLPAWATDHAGKKILYINSYHSGYAWGDAITEGVEDVLDGRGVTLKIHWMDTKRNQDMAFLKEAALEAKAVVEAFKPDVVIVSDDNAAKYLLKPYFRGAGLPFVFCGVNWDASVYDLPYSNTTGMVEMELIRPLLTQLRRHARGDKIGHLAVGSLTSRKNAGWHKRALGVDYERIHFVDNYQEWKRRYLELQEEVDILILGNTQTLAGWDKKDAVRFVHRNTLIPTGTSNPGIKDFALIGYLRVPHEYGSWAARSALKILEGADPASIPVTRNRKGRVVINQALSEKLGVVFEPALFKRAQIVWPYQGRRVLHVASYHPEFFWTSGIHRGIERALAHSGVELRVLYMDTKRNRSREFMQQAVRNARQVIEDFAPEVVITSDDNAAKYLIAPHYKDTDLPFVFCGVNWDASVYGLPAGNVTGMEEVELVEPLIRQLRRYARGDRLGILSTNTLSGRRNIEYHDKLFGIHYDRIYRADTFDEWKQAYLKLQKEVDMMITETHTAVAGWNREEFDRFAEEHIRIPTGSTAVDRASYSVLSYGRIPEEQGEWAAKTALQILDGTPPGEIPVVRNRQSKLYLNVRLSNKLNLVIDRSIYRRAEIVQ
ncbi:MAG: hypothetical protein GY731_19760 [Gammaproteobacteria bacterium]|nr:hypothetical protein [Gammaproteobacteria bacterium]